MKFILTLGIFLVISYCSRIFKGIMLKGEYFITLQCNSYTASGHVKMPWKSIYLLHKKEILPAAIQMSLQCISYCLKIVHTTESSNCTCEKMLDHFINRIYIIKPESLKNYDLCNNPAEQLVLCNHKVVQCKTVYITYFNDNDITKCVDETSRQLKMFAFNLIQFPQRFNFSTSWEIKTSHGF